MFYETLDDKKVRCNLCPQLCTLGPGQNGICRGRMNKDGKLVALTYAETISLSNDPVEKKPLYHFYPGKYLLSMGPNACNLKCQHCQNWEVSQTKVRTSRISPEQAVEFAQSTRNCVGLSFTYTEPLMWYEYVLETAKIARSKGVKITLVTNGFINPTPAEKLLPLVDAINLDIKSMDDDFYRKVCGAKLQPVLDFAKQAKPMTMLEITNLLIPGHNDRSDQVQMLVDWVHDNLGPNTPLHFSRYFPRYKMTSPATPIETLLKARKMATEKLKFVYVGNVMNDNLHNTYCPNCGELLVERSGYSVRIAKLKSEKCGNCGEQIPIVTS
ncbi:MAG: AmmeMemoRadiSam system radical SAM enzyme [Candidatus Coatesbacteria bacterium]|nr:AmmeMemoRadiSam system radical SAM enzyme [Candidatus Coatesbacteria bacterium]